jgi:hypothetical protein
MWNTSQATGPRTCESGAWQRMISRSCSILSMKGPPWLFPETTVPPNSFCLGIASPLGNHRGPRALLVTGMRNTPRKSPPTLCCSGPTRRSHSSHYLCCGNSKRTPRHFCGHIQEKRGHHFRGWQVCSLLIGSSARNVRASRRIEGDGLG